MTKLTNNPIDKHVGSRIRSLRLSHRLSVSQLASLIGVTERDIERFEDGAIRVGAEILGRVANAFNVRSLSFFDGAENFRDLAPLGKDILIYGRPDETRELVSAFVQIENAEARRKIIDLAVCFAAVPKSE